MCVCRYWKYFDYKLEEGPSDINQYGLPSALQNMDAAFIWERNYKTYFFKGGYYWRYNENSKSIDANYPRPVSVWGKKQSNTKALYFPVTDIMTQTHYRNLGFLRQPVSYQ